MRLKVDKVSFSYDSLAALKEVCFEVKTGEILGIIGPNGSGKTTLLKCINNILKPKRGVVFLDELNISSLRRKEIAKKVGVVPQNSVNRFDFTVFDAVLMGRFPYLGRFDRETKQDFDIVDRALELTGIQNLSSRLITEISGGEYQKVIIARALAQEPQVLLLDEPTLHLDISHQIEFLELLKLLARNEGLIVIIVSHDLNLAARYSDRVLILKEGEIYQAGVPEEVFIPKHIKDVYGIEVEIIRSSATNSINIIPLQFLRQNPGTQK